MRPKLAFAMQADKTRHVFDAEALARLERTVDIVRREPLEEFSSPQARAVLAEIDILITGWGSPMVTPEVVRAASRLKLIAHAAGTVKFTLDRVVYAAGIRVTHAADANAVPVAEFTLASIILPTSACSNCAIAIALIPAEGRATPLWTNRLATTTAR